MRRTRVLVRTAVIIGALGVAFPSAARAGSIVLASDFTGEQVHYEFHYTLNNQSVDLLVRPVTFGSVTMNGGTELNETLNGLQFEAYCADILTDVLDPTAGQPDVGGTYDATVSSMSGWQEPNGLASPLDGNLRAAYLYNKYGDSNSPDALVVGDLQGRSALQLAIWDVLYDNDYTVASNSTGSLHVSTAGLTEQTDPNHPNDQAQIDGYNAIAARAQAFQDDVRVADVTGSDAAWIKLSVPGGKIEAQDFIGPKSVPEPGSLLLLGTGLAALTAFRRKSLRRS